MSNAMRKMLNNAAAWDNYALVMMDCAPAYVDNYAHVYNNNRIKVCLFDIPFVC